MIEGHNLIPALHTMSRIQLQIKMLTKSHWTLGNSLLQRSEPSSLLLEVPDNLAMREPNWIALLGSLLAPWQPSIAAASLSSLFSPTPLGRKRST